MYIAIALLLIILIPFIFFIRKSNAAIKLEQLEGESKKNIATDCCGAHEICEFDEADFNGEKIVYFDDEELDELRNLVEDELTASQIDKIRDVLYTLKADEINQWLTSMNRRHIHLPIILKQEARQLIADSK